MPFSRFLNMRADGRLAQRQPLRRFGKTAELSDPVEDLEFVEIEVFLWPSHLFLESEARLGIPLQPGLDKRRSGAAPLAAGYNLLL